MVGFKELFARVQSSFKFSRQELSGIVVAILVLGFVFSFWDWGEEQFELLTGLKHLLTAFIIVAISLFFKISCQKIYSLGQGQSSEFNVWWGGLIADLIVIFITAGVVPLALAGGIVSSFMVKQRLGEFRYGFSIQTLAKTALWGISANLLLALFFAIGAYFYPQNYFFAKGLIFNLVLAFC